MKKYSLAALIGGAVIAIVPASASPTTFDFANLQGGSTGNSYGDSLSFMVNGITVTETAFSLGAGYTTGSTFVKAAVDDYAGAKLGLGICSVNDPSGASCGDPNHQVDNLVGDEFVLFTFSSAVSLGNGSSITVANFDSDGGTKVDLTYYSAATAITTSTTLLTEGAGQTVNNTGGPGNVITYSNLVGGASITHLLVGASVLDASGDAFKINSLTVNSGSQQSATPEPATFGLIGLALTGLGIASRKRKANRS